MQVRVLAIGDIVGKPGRAILRERLREFRREESLHFVVANGENVAQGAGITPDDADDLFKSGVDVITCGDHVWNKKEIIPYIEKTPAVLRPANYLDDQPGRGAVVLEAGGVKFAVLHLQGNVFMHTPAGNPFRTADQWIEKFRAETKIVLVDMHCEATSEKVAMGWHLDGRASFVFGTHTHVQTADERLMPKGTAYITDVGMTGPYESVIGRRVDRVLHRFTTGLPAFFEVATGDVRMCGAIATIDTDTGLATEIRRVVLKQAAPIPSPAR